MARYTTRSFKEYAGNPPHVMSWGSTLDLQRSSLRWDIKRTMKSLCTKLEEIGEECFVVTANVNNGWVGHIGSFRGNEYIEEKSHILYDFLNYCGESCYDSSIDDRESDYYTSDEDPQCGLEIEFDEDSDSRGSQEVVKKSEGPSIDSDMKIKEHNEPKQNDDYGDSSVKTVHKVKKLQDLSSKEILLGEEDMEANSENSVTVPPRLVGTTNTPTVRQLLQMPTLSKHSNMDSKSQVTQTALEDSASLKSLPREQGVKRKKPEPLVYLKLDQPSAKKTVKVSKNTKIPAGKSRSSSTETETELSSDENESSKPIPKRFLRSTRKRKSTKPSLASLLSRRKLPGNDENEPSSENEESPEEQSEELEIYLEGDDPNDKDWALENTSRGRSVKKK